MATPRVTSRDSPERHRAAADNPVLRNRIARIYRATRFEPTRRSIERMDNWRNGATIDRDNTNSDRSRSPQNRRAEASVVRKMCPLHIHSSNRPEGPHLHLFLLDGKPETCGRFQIRIFFPLLALHAPSCAFGAD